eukprot:TRINITY_DN60509_c0_g1_i1.p2 TRINITY_DN60509_c0_g1~~TRINITY_DN60509_c0_g1_i1.p2  ORF type:complete len:189 (-),score=20.34 TRINITY_DN60509_c0_g1_i1:1429-1995(-)
MANSFEAQPAPFSDTLDEPIHATILRDAKAIGRKIKVVVGLQRDASRNELRNWDLWGPLLLCLLLAMILGFKDNKEPGMTFAGVFTTMGAGSIIVTLNGQFLGGNLSFFQIVCVLGYCVFPLCAAALISAFVNVLVVKLIVTAVGWVWAVIGSVGFFTGAVREERKILVVYPIVLFYFVVGYFIIAGI